MCAHGGVSASCSPAVQDCVFVCVIVCEYADRAFEDRLLPCCSPLRLWLAALSRTETSANICISALWPYWWAATSFDEYALCLRTFPVGESQAIQEIRKEFRGTFQRPELYTNLSVAKTRWRVNLNWITVALLWVLQCHVSLMRKYGLLSFNYCCRVISPHLPMFLNHSIWYYSYYLWSWVRGGSIHLPDLLFSSLHYSYSLRSPWWANMKYLCSASLLIKNTIHRVSCLLVTSRGSVWV